MRPNKYFQWELRIRKFRVYYELLEQEEEPGVLILAVGEKVRNKVWIGGQEFKIT